MRINKALVGKRKQGADRSVAQQCVSLVEQQALRFRTDLLDVGRDWTAYFVCFTQAAVMLSSYEDNGLHHIILVSMVWIA